MKSNIKSKLIGNLLSDGSVSILPVFSFNSRGGLNAKNADILNHPIWTGRRPKEQTEISAFIGRFNKSHS